jgi:hypothetical protein
MTGNKAIRKGALSFFFFQHWLGAGRERLFRKHGIWQSTEALLRKRNTTPSNFVTCLPVLTALQFLTRVEIVGLAALGVAMEGVAAPAEALDEAAAEAVSGLGGAFL